MIFEDGKVRELPIVYLAGAMSAAPDKGAGWRRDITPYLNSLGYQLFNPVIHQPLSDIHQLPHINNVDELKEVCTKIVDTDLEVLSRSSLLIVKLDKYALRSAGTLGEITFAHSKKIPVFAWVDLEGGLNEVPYWAFGCIDLYSLHLLDFYKLIPPASVFENRKVDRSI